MMVRLPLTPVARRTTLSVVVAQLLLLPALLLLPGRLSAQPTQDLPDPAAPGDQGSLDQAGPDNAELGQDGAESQFRGTDRSDLDLIEGLLEEGEESVDTGFVYDPGGRRDPFRTLLRTPDQVERKDGPRPEGIPGLLIENLTVTAVWMFPEGPTAQVRSAEEPISYLLRPGTKVFDGEVISVTWDREEGGKVVFRQIVRDPTSPKPFKEVVRRIQQ